MITAKVPRVAYILKMYPRFSETFIVNEILAHEEAGQPVWIYSLRPPVDGRFHESYARVQAQVRYVPDEASKVSTFWPLFQQACVEFPQLWSLLQEPMLEARDLWQALWLARTVREDGISLLHAHFGSVSTTVARLTSRLTGIPYVFTAHAKDIFHESVDFYDLHHKLVDAACTITVSDFNVRHLYSQYGEAARRVQRVYNGLDLSNFPFQSPAQRPRHIVAVGRLIEKKGFDVLVEACAILANRGTRFTCDIIGSGDMEVPLRTQITANNLDGHVRLLGPQPQGNVIRQVQAGAVFAAPCVIGSDGNRDGLPTVLLEAMALGTPCISTDVTGIPEILHHEQTGLLVSQRSPTELADALARLLGDADLRVRLAANARAQIEENFDVRRNAAQIRQIYGAAVETTHTNGRIAMVAEVV
jgi:glycosyltransferase involved in cell wall biosynthesis